MITPTDSPPFSGFVEHSRKKFRFIPIEKTWINSRTPVGDSAEFYERKPYGGKREFYPLLEIKNGKLIECYKAMYVSENRRWEYIMPRELLTLLNEKNIEIPALVGGIQAHVVKNLE
jgi:hypothetical protein